MRFRSMDSAPRDGRGFLAYGRHPDPVRPDAGRGVKPGDHWWAILLFDAWRRCGELVFAKDGAPAWSEPLGWAELEIPETIEQGGS